MRLLQHGLALLVALVVVPYLVSPVYDLAPSSRFTGASWYNPYAGWRGPGLRTNLHAHSVAWGGVTHGKDTPGDVYAAYRRRAYDVASLSNYHRLDTAGASGIVVPTYEHGINAFKSHRLAVGASRVEWFDFPLGQTTEHKQYILDRLHAGSELVAIVHPALRGGHSTDDLARLTGYELLEVLNHFGIAESHWDAALSAGRPVWAIGNDDTHDAMDAGQTGVMWTQVGADAPSRDGVIAALRAGRHVAVASPTGRADIALEHADVTRNVLHVRFTSRPEKIDAVIDGGRRLPVRVDGRDARFEIPGSATYVRLVASTPAATLYLNPIIRSDGTLPMVAASTVNEPATVLQRAVSFGVLGWLLAGTGSPRRARRTRRLPRRPAGTPRWVASVRRWARASSRLRVAIGRRRAGVSARVAVPAGRTRDVSG